MKKRQGILGKGDKLLIEIKKLSILIKNYHQGTERERMKKLMVKRCDKLIDLGENVNERWKNVVLEDLKGDKEVWEIIMESYPITEFKKKVGVENFNEILKA